MADNPPPLTDEDMAVLAELTVAMIEAPDRSHQVRLPSPIAMVQVMRRFLDLLSKVPKPRRSSGGRPAGSSMGEQVARLVANGIPEDQAIEAVAKPPHKPIESVKRSYDSVKRQAKNPPAQQRNAQKKPR